jgi:hypothetical protein
MRLYRVRQRLVSNPLGDVAEEVRRALDACDITVPQGEVAITAGSRGISQIALIAKTAGAWLRERGAKPFLVPCMGSHNGATAEGQLEMVRTLGMTEEATGIAIRSGMEVVRLGTVSTGDVYMDRHCHQAAGVLVLNRIKLHTCFSGPIQSGLTKMMVVGMGKIRSAETFHAAPTSRMKDMLSEMGGMILRSGKILAGLAILEDGFDRTAEIHAVPPHRIPAREPELLERHRRYFPRLPVDELNVLVVGGIGKTYSGTGMDPNVIGRRGIRDFEDLTSPRIRVIAALSLAPASHGNAIGMGLADFITQRLRDAIDEDKTILNVYTTGEMERAKIPATLANDEVLVDKIRERYGSHRWMFIANTHQLATLYVSADMREEVAARSDCEVEPEPVELPFPHGQLALPFDTG